MEAGYPPAAVVLVDTYEGDGAAAADLRDELWRALYAREHVVDSLDWARLSAYVWTERLVADWRPPSLPAPTLLLRATRRLGGAEDGGGACSRPWLTPTRSSMCLTTTSPWWRSTGTRR
jgi:polyketide synthase 7